MKIDKQAIRTLADLLEETGLVEIEVADEGQKIRVSRASAAVAHAFPITDPGQPLRANTAQPHNIPTPVASGDQPGLVKSPMVGTVYLCPEPGAEAFAPVGKTVKPGDTLLIIEAMKVMNAIKADKAGVVQAVLAVDGKPVEFGDPLILVQ
jgi:acetyl-CoA carboxylase biotin carboxyl carrier protein